MSVNSVFFGNGEDIRLKTDETEEIKKKKSSPSIFMESTGASNPVEKTELSAAISTETEKTDVAQKSEHVDFKSLTEDEKNQKVHKWAQDRRADEQKLGELAEEPVMIEWRERTRNRTDVEQVWKRLKESGLSDEEIGERFKEAEMKCLEEDTQYLQEQFEKNPDLRVKLQENFDKLSRSEQKALLNEFYKSDRKGGMTEEVARLMKGLEKSSDEVKSLAVAALRNNKNVTEEQCQEFIKRLNYMEKDVVKRLPKHSAPEQVLIANDRINDRTSVARADLARQFPDCDKDAIPFMLKAFTQSENIKNDEEAKSAYIDVLKKYDDKNQILASKYGIDSLNFNSENRNGIIGEIKNFRNAENQTIISKYVTDSGRVDTDNRLKMLSELKNLNKSVQYEVAKYFGESEKNLSNDAVMREYRNEIKNLKIKEEEKALLQKYFEQKQAAQAAREKEINDLKAAEELAEAEEAHACELNRLKAEAAANAEITDAGLAKLVQGGQAVFGNTVKTPRPTSYSDLTSRINSGEISLSAMQKGGYTKYAIACMNDLTEEKQEELIATVDMKQLAYMHSAGLIPVRLKNLALSRVLQNPSAVTVNMAAKCIDNPQDMITLYNALSDDRFKNTVMETFSKRFHKSYEYYVEKHQNQAA